MVNKIIVVLLIIVFIVGLVFASIFVNKNAVDFNIENSNSGDNINEGENMHYGVNDRPNNNWSQSNVEQNLNKNEESENMGILEMTNENFENEVLKSEKTVLIDFYAEWCGPCKMMVPIVEKVASENSDIKVVKVNIDNEEELAIKYRVMSIPTFVVIKNGEEVNRIVGAVDKTTLESIIK